MAKYDKYLEKMPSCVCGGRPHIKKIRGKGFEITCTSENCTNKAYSPDLERAVANWVMMQGGMRGL